jgi:hypothetical protein
MFIKDLNNFSTLSACVLLHRIQESRNLRQINNVLNFSVIQHVPGGKVNIPGGHSIGHSKQNCIRVVSYSERFPRQLFHCTVPKLLIIKKRYYVLFLFFFQWLFQPIQGPGLLFSSVIIFHRRQNCLDEGSACRKAAT